MALAVSADVEANATKYAPVPGKIPGTALNLGGHDLVLAPLTLDQIQALTAQIEKLGAVANMADLVATALPVIHASLMRNYPDMTLEDVRALVDVGNIRKASQAVIGVSGFEFAEPGETTPRGQ